jgi:hypothetical protein
MIDMVFKVIGRDNDWPLPLENDSRDRIDSSEGMLVES